jgi:hypothetical protein
MHEPHDVVELILERREANIPVKLPIVSKSGRMYDSETLTSPMFRRFAINSSLKRLGAPRARAARATPDARQTPRSSGSESKRARLRLTPYPRSSLARTFRSRSSNSLVPSS